MNGNIIFMKKLIFIFCICLSVRSLAQDKAYQKALNFFDKSKFEQGFSELDKLIEKNPENHQYLFTRAYYLYQTEDFEKAILDFSQVIGLFPDDTSAYRYRAMCYTETEKFTWAARDFKIVLSLDSNNINIQNELGYFYSKTENYTKAISIFKKTTAIQPNAFAYYQLANCYYETADYQQAIICLDNCIKLDKNYTDAFRLKAIIMAIQKKYKEADKIYQQLLAEGELKEEEDFLNWGLIFYVQKNYTKALQYFLTPKNTVSPTLFHYMGLSYFKQKKYDFSMFAFDKAVSLAGEEDENYADVFYNRAIVRNQLNDKKGAVKDLLTAVYLSPEITKQQAANGDTLELLGNAVKLLQKSYKSKQIDSAMLTGYQARTELMLDNQDPINLLATINEAISLDTNEIYSYFLRGKVYYFLEKYEKSVEDFSKVIFLQQSGKADSYYYRGLSNSSLGNYESALKDFDESIRLDSQNASAFEARCITFYKLKNMKGSFTDINTAMMLRPKEIHFLVIRAFLYNEENEFALAIADCEKVLKQNPEHPAAYFQKGMALWGLGKLSDAADDFRMALYLDPDFEDATDALTDLMRELKR
ncbi:MAG: tetratricopeptide repeat protein [Verrucomicrobia bacterium]|nr:tetratricopeptide repeat protein [Cytophagales bacterium]